MKKHAYLIMAHNNPYILKKLLNLIDDKRNDIYLHIDKKSKLFNVQEINNIVKNSNLYFTKRIDVRWGDFSQIECEYLLLKESKNKNYEYYHFISGVDLPLKTQDEIHDFFQKNNGKEIVQLTTDEIINKRNAYYRISRFHFFQKIAKSNRRLERTFYNAFQNVFMPIQSILKVDRIKKLDIKVGYGANWVSITNDFANYVLKQETWVRKVFKYSLCADELFIQTLLVNSKFKENVYKEPSNNFNGDACMRYIDWKRGNPYVFKEEDLERLLKSRMLFARKFDVETNKKIIDDIYMILKEKQNK